jgi:hypothetical protein
MCCTFMCGCLHGSCWLMRCEWGSDPPFHSGWWICHWEIRDRLTVLCLHAKTANLQVVNDWSTCLMFHRQVKPYFMPSEPNETFTKGLYSLRHIGIIELKAYTEHRYVCLKFYLSYLHCGESFLCCFLVRIRELAGLRQALNMRKDLYFRSSKRSTYTPV